MNLGKIFLIVISVLILLAGLASMIGGGALTWSNYFLKDDDGFYSSKAADINRDSFAITTSPADIELDPHWVLNWVEKVKVKFTATNKTEGKETFIGIAKEETLSDYLGDSDYDEIEEFRTKNLSSEPQISYKRHSGNSAPETPPTSLKSWTASAHGDGQQVLEWRLEEGTYSMVLMNADGSRGLKFSGSVGVKIPVIPGLGLGLLIGGLFLIALAFLGVYATVTRMENS